MRYSSTKKVVLIGAFWALFFSSQNVWCVGDDFQTIRARVLGSQDLTELIESITTEDGLDINRLEVEDLLHAAVLRGHAAMVEGLAALGMDVDRLNHEGFAPLHYAAQRGGIGILFAAFWRPGLMCMFELKLVFMAIHR